MSADSMPRPVNDEGPRPDVPREERFLRLLLAHERQVFAYILALVPHWSDAEDVLQETSAVLWRKFEDFTPGTDFIAWALGVARFQVLNFRKKQRQARGRLSDQAVEAIADRMLVVARQGDVRMDALESCLQKLSAHDRELIQRRYQPAATTQNVAEAVGRSLRAVYKALNRIHDQLLACVRQAIATEGNR